ncbi:phospholipase D family protein [Pontibaca salina]|uniref:Phospholipase D n=1 Tax=Pontibaca salina TaxID=2795731 RepID=A0A934HIK9_9RHOB|nr:phospholipase D family protein [Pontibaca salina]MBI6628834.1 phospholipase D family protein [Pontibaca salina]
MMATLRYTALTLLVIALTIMISRFIFVLPPNEKTQGTHLPPVETGPLAEALIPQLRQHEGKTGIAPLQSGGDAFAARMILADAAVSSIDAQYYIWHDDLTGLLLLDALKRAANRGVRVRLLLDDNGTSGLDPEIAALDAHPMAEVRLYNPFNLRRFKLLSYGFDFFRLNRRMHNKSFTVDSRATILGGRNVGNEYFDTGLMPLYIDLDALAVGKVVSEVSQDFDRYWNSRSVHAAAPIVGAPPQDDPIASRLASFQGDPQIGEYRDILNSLDIVGALARGTIELEWTDVLLISDDPAKGEGVVPRDDLLAVRLMQAVGNVETRFDGISPYFVPGVAGVEFFAGLVRDGVEVRLLTNSLEATDVLPVHAGYSKRRKAMLDADISLYELRRQAALDAPRDVMGPFGSSGASLHAKTFAVDEQRIFIGSFNFDPRSTSINTEMGLLIDSRTLAGQMHRAFDNGFGGLAWKVEKRNRDLIWISAEKPGAQPRMDEPGGSFLRRVAVTVIGWLPVEWML